MSAVTSFKVAFLSRCAEEGLILEQIHERVKTAVARAEAKYGETEKEAGMGRNIALSSLLLGAGGGAVQQAWPSLASAEGLNEVSSTSQRVNRFCSAACPPRSLRSSVSS